MRLDSAIAQLLGRVRRRLRWGRALEAGAWALSGALLVAALVTLLARVGWVSGALRNRLLVIELLAVIGAALIAALRPLSLATVALQIDGRAGLHERLSSAVAFSELAQPTRFMQAALADAARVAGSVRVGQVAPLSWPRAGRLVGAGLLLWAGARFVPGRHAVVVVAPRPAEAVALVVDHDQLEPDAQAVSELVKESGRDGEADELHRAATELAALLQALDADASDGKISRAEAFARLAQIQSRLPSDPARDAEQLKSALAKTSQALSGERITQKTADALAKEDLTAARAELEKLAAAAEARAEERQKQNDQAKPLSDAEKQQLARSLDRATQSHQQEQKRVAEEQRQKERQQQLKDEQRRLQRQLQQHPQDQEAERRLQRNQRELERLEREQQQAEQQKRQLERLQRELERAAESLRQKMSPEAAAALRKAAQEMGRMEDELRKLSQMQKMQLEIGEVKEVIRRAGRAPGSGGPGQSGPAQNGQNGPGQNGQSQNGDGQNSGAAQGKGKGQGKGGSAQSQLMREFQKGAHGNQKEQALLLGGKGSEQNQTLLLPIPAGNDPHGGGKPPGKDPGGGGNPNRPNSGDGIGDQHDPNMLGARTDSHGNHQATRVTGQEGAGPSRSETIAGSAQHGFATEHYQKVFSDYSSVLEEVMQKENVPPGYRYYVKRYFQLIAPR